MKAYLSVFFIFFALSVSCEDFQSSRCSRLKDFKDCIDNINTEVLDSSKCLPITEVTNAIIHHPSNEKDEEEDSLVCASWKDIQDNEFSIDYESEQEFISEEEKLAVSKVVQFSKWAAYAYSSVAGEEFLKDFKVVENEEFGAKMIMGYDPESNSIISSFRGSINLVNYIEDADFIKTDYGLCEGCQVHKGFLFTYNQIRQESIGYLEEMVAKYPEAEVVSVGHSLGAALSVLGALDQAQYVDKVNLYNYGQPRVGNEEFALYQNEVLKGDSLRAVYMNDPAPTVPYEAVLNYFHGGREVHFYGCGETDYILYPFNKDDKPFTDLSSGDDHQGYWCFTEQVKEMDSFSPLA